MTDSCLLERFTVIFNEEGDYKMSDKQRENCVVGLRWRGTIELLQKINNLIGITDKG